jgi:H+/Cl- antiporter ClcA
MEVNRSLDHKAWDFRRERKRLIVAVFSFLLISGFLVSGVLFSADLTLGKILESHGVHDRASLLRANDQLWRLLPLQLLILGIGAVFIVLQVANPRRSGWKKALSLLARFGGTFSALLLLDYIVGILLPDGWALRVLHALAR